MNDAMHALIDAAEKASEAVPLETAKKILEGVLHDLETEREEHASTSSYCHRLEERVERLEAREMPMTAFRAAIQHAHEEARHGGAWDLCPHPVCRSLERYLTAEAKDGAR